MVYIYVKLHICANVAHVNGIIGKNKIALDRTCTWKKYQDNKHVPWFSLVNIYCLKH